eukprot:RCo033221
MRKLIAAYLPPAPVSPERRASPPRPGVRFSGEDPSSSSPDLTPVVVQLRLENQQLSQRLAAAVSNAGLLEQLAIEREQTIVRLREELSQSMARSSAPVPPPEPPRSLRCPVCAAASVQAQLERISSLSDHTTEHGEGSVPQSPMDGHVAPLAEMCWELAADSSLVKKLPRKSPRKSRGGCGDASTQWDPTDACESFRGDRTS